MGDPDETLLLEEVGRRLRARRSDLGRTVKAVALDAGLSLPYVANLENGRGNPTLDTLERLASTLQISLAELLAPAEPRTSLVDERLPASLTRFSRTNDFRTTCDRLARAQNVGAAQMRREVLLAMASCPRPGNRRTTEADWKRLLDAITLILM